MEGAMDTLFLLVGLSALSWLLVLGVLHWARRRQILDIPNHRSSHSRPTPRGGGLVIVAVTLVAGVGYAAWHPAQWSLLAYLLGMSVIALVGWVDDLRSIPYRVRFVCHIFAALLILVALGLSHAFVSSPVPWWAAAPVLMIWLVGLTNVYNFMDGIDGLDGGQAVAAACWWLVIGTLLGMPAIATLALAVAASSAGFLLHNWSPARIFMGDVGSTSLGYTFAVLPLLSWQLSGQWSMLIGGALVVWPFIFDGGLTIIRRALRGENIFQAHRSHLYQRLVIGGWRHSTVSALYIVYALVCAVCAFALVVGGWHWSVSLIPIGLGAVLFWWVGRIERHPARDAAVF
jgi:UDP-N-acetylmuramyl pentapeptide phosphotransferase/UDP-N-acetylglucosamine-1-phosphate transferase